MTHRRKALTIGILAVLAFGTVMASAAQAGEFRVEKYPANIEGKGSEGTVLETVMGVVKCGVISLTGVLEEPESESLEMTPTFEKCTLGGSTVDFKNNGCGARYTLGSTINGNPDELSGSMDIVCPPNQKIEFVYTPSGCTESIPPQNGMGEVKWTNETLAKPMDVKGDINVTNMHYTMSASCSKPGTYNNGTWNGNLTNTAPSSSTGFTVT
jgi:hypothetical protein